MLSRRSAPNLLCSAERGIHSLNFFIELSAKTFVLCMRNNLSSSAESAPGTKSHFARDQCAEERARERKNGAFIGFYLYFCFFGGTVVGVALSVTFGCSFFGIQECEILMDASSPVRSALARDPSDRHSRVPRIFHAHCFDFDWANRARRGAECERNLR